MTLSSFNNHRLRAHQALSIEVKTEALPLHQPADLPTDLLEQRRTHIGMAIDLINKTLPISRRHAMASDPGFHLAAKGLQQSGLVLSQGLGAGMGDVHGANRCSAVQQPPTTRSVATILESGSQRSAELVTTDRKNPQFRV